MCRLLNVLAGVEFVEPLHRSKQQPGLDAETDPQVSLTNGGIA
jgi:hypothetical protein